MERRSPAGRCTTRSECGDIPCPCLCLVLGFVDGVEVADFESGEHPRLKRCSNFPCAEMISACPIPRCRRPKRRPKVGATDTKSFFCALRFAPRRPSAERKGRPKSRIRRDPKSMAGGDATRSSEVRTSLVGVSCPVPDQHSVHIDIVEDGGSEIVRASRILSFVEDDLDPFDRPDDLRERRGSGPPQPNPP
jgi:hypothetical protein